MTAQLQVKNDLPSPASGAAGAEDNAKRQQIVEGARGIFLAQGFDAASMNDIARAAGVSKGTLYVYFKDKVALFKAIVEDECTAHAEGVFTLDHNDPDVESVLTRLGMSFVPYLCRKGKSAVLRTVIAIADRMPEVGRIFYETGPAHGIQLVADYLRAQNKAGVLKVEDPEIAAAQFLDACQATLFKPVLFNFGPPPDENRIAHVVRIAAKTFMAAYGVRSSQDNER